VSSERQDTGVHRRATGERRESGAEEPRIFVNSHAPTPGCEAGATVRAQYSVSQNNVMPLGPDICVSKPGCIIFNIDTLLPFKTAPHGVGRKDRRAARLIVTS
jgi:hypothetical protein